MNNFQREGSISNAHVGSSFEKTIANFFRTQGLDLTSNYSLRLGVEKIKKHHDFDLGSHEPPIIVECKSHKWTKGGNVPSAKMTVWNEAMYYFHLAPKGYRKIFFVLKDYCMRRKKTLAEYYIETHAHLIPSDVEIWEYNTERGRGKKLPR